MFKKVKQLTATLRKMLFPSKQNFDEGDFFFILEKVLNQFVIVSPCLLIAYLYAMVAFPYRNFSWKELQQVWYDWQTLNAGLIAYFAAVLIYVSAKASAKQQEKAKREVDRVKLSKALSSLCRYAEESIIFLMDCNRALDLKKVNADIKITELPCFDQLAYDMICESIYSSEKVISNYLVNVLHDLQIIDARLRGHRREVVAIDSEFLFTHNSFMSLMVDCLIIHRNASALFDYSREGKGISTYVSLYNSCNSLPIPAETRARVEEYITQTDSNSIKFISSFR